MAKHKKPCFIPLKNKYENAACTRCGYPFKVGATFYWRPPEFREAIHCAKLCATCIGEGNSHRFCDIACIDIQCEMNTRSLSDILQDKYGIIPEGL
jgi:hypothetical protein